MCAFSEINSVSSVPLVCSYDLSSLIRNLCNINLPTNGFLKSLTCFVPMQKHKKKLTCFVRIFLILSKIVTLLEFGGISTL